MGFFGSIGKGIKRSFEKNKADKEELKKLRRQMDIEEKLAFEKEFKKQSLEAAKIRAKERAAKFTGMAKLKELQKLDSLKKRDPSHMSRLSTMMQRNLQRTEENKKRNLETQRLVKEEREKKIKERQALQEQRKLEQLQRNVKRLEERRDRLSHNQSSPFLR